MIKINWIPTDEFYRRLLAEPDAAARRQLYLDLLVDLMLVRRLMPGYILTTEQFGRAMLVVARRGATKRVLENRDIAALAAG